MNMPTKTNDFVESNRYMSICVVPGLFCQLLTCQSDPCQHNATCQADPYRGFQCDCTHTGRCSCVEQYRSA
jgi:hypothetical protein